jgi:hypothetical protein
VPFSTTARTHRAVRALAATALAAGLSVALAGTAHADPTVYLTCSKDGYTGTLRIDYIQRAGGTEYVPGGVSFRITPGSRAGTNADVVFTDGGTIPARSYSTGTARQDGQWRTLSSAAYTRGNGTSTVQFVFDKSFSTDPRCTASRTW